jgi:hypothetical protein
MENAEQKIRGTFTDETLSEFLLLADWLGEFAKICPSQGMKDFTLLMAEHFRINPMNIKV